MDHRKSITCVSGRYLLLVLLGILLSACSWLPGNKQNTGSDKTASNLVELVDGGLVLSESAVPGLVLTLVNVSDQLLWVSVHFQTPDGLTDCIVAKEVEPKDGRLYSCSQRDIRAETDYPVQIMIFKNVQQAEPLKTLDTSFRFSKADIQALNR